MNIMQEILKTAKDCPFCGGIHFRSEVCDCSVAQVAWEETLKLLTNKRDGI